MTIFRHRLSCVWYPTYVSQSSASSPTVVPWLSAAFPVCRHCQQTFGMRHPPIIHDVGDGHLLLQITALKFPLSCLGPMSGGYLMHEQLAPSLPGLPPLSLLPKYSIFCILRLQSPADFQVPPTPSCSVQGAKFSEAHWNIKPRKDTVVDSCGLTAVTRNLNWLSQHNMMHDGSVHWLSQNVRAVDIGHATKHWASLVSTCLFFNSVRNTEEHQYIVWGSLQTECICNGIMRCRSIILFECYYTSQKKAPKVRYCQIRFRPRMWKWTGYDSDICQRICGRSRQTNGAASHTSLKVQRLRI